MSSSRDNVILFPKTVEYYQIQLTRLLESEQYAEAVRLLRFLLQCQADDHRTFEEWKMLLKWLETTFVESDESEEEATEGELYQRHIREKAANDPHYTKNLLEVLLEDPALERKMLALEQLIVIDHPQINDTLRRWAVEVELHPLVQFKVLQTLKIRGDKGVVQLEKCGETVHLDIQETPLEFDEFPASMSAILDKVKEISEIHHPALTYFAEQTWKEYLSYIYGSSKYENLKRIDSAMIPVWAAGLYHVVMETVLGAADESETRQLYGIAKSNAPQWKHAYRTLKNYLNPACRHT